MHNGRKSRALLGLILSKSTRTTGIRLTGLHAHTHKYTHTHTHTHTRARAHSTHGHTHTHTHTHTHATITTTPCSSAESEKHAFMKLSFSTDPPPPLHQFGLTERAMGPKHSFRKQIRSAKRDAHEKHVATTEHNRILLTTCPSKYQAENDLLGTETQQEQIFPHCHPFSLVCSQYVTDFLWSHRKIHL